MDTPTDPPDPDSAPEVPPGMEKIIEWDEPETASGIRAPSLRPADESDATLLVTEGIEEADREARLEDSTDEETAGLDILPPPQAGILS